MTHLLEPFRSLEDPRVTGRSAHLLLDMVALAIVATVCGCEGWDEIHRFGEAKKTWLQTFLSLPHGIPSADTIRRVFAALEPKAFAACFTSWMKSLMGSTRGQWIAIDGKTARRSFDRAAALSPLHLVRAWSQKNNLVLGQVATDAKSNEITAIPALLEMLAVRGAVITIDAMGTQKAIAQKITEKGASYILALKGNQDTLHQQVIDLFRHADTGAWPTVPKTSFVSEEYSHGRQERREVCTSTAVDRLGEAPKWAGLARVTRVRSWRTIGEKTTVEDRYYISSIPRCGAKRMAALIRGHWSIENNCHWVLDVQMREDENRVRDGHGAENLALVRNIALNLLKQDTTARCGIKAKQKLAGWDGDYLLRVLSHGIIDL